MESKAGFALFRSIRLLPRKPLPCKLGLRGRSICTDGRSSTLFSNERLRSLIGGVRGPKKRAVPQRRVPPPELQDLATMQPPEQQRQQQEGSLCFQQQFRAPQRYLSLSSSHAQARERLQIITGLLKPSAPCSTPKKAPMKKLPAPLPFLDFSRPRASLVPKPKIVGGRRGQVELKWNADPQGVPRRETLQERNRISLARDGGILQIQRIGGSTKAGNGHRCIMMSTSIRENSSLDDPGNMYTIDSPEKAEPVGQSANISFANIVGADMRRGSTGNVAAKGRLPSTNTGDELEMGVGTCAQDLRNSRAMYFNLSVNFSKGGKLCRIKNRCRHRRIFKAM